MNLIASDVYNLNSIIKSQIESCYFSNHMQNQLYFVNEVLHSIAENRNFIISSSLVTHLIKFVPITLPETLQLYWLSLF